MNGKRLLYIDQYGNKFFASTVKELREKVAETSCMWATSSASTGSPPTLPTSSVSGGAHHAPRHF